MMGEYLIDFSSDLPRRGRASGQAMILADDRAMNTWNTWNTWQSNSRGSCIDMLTPRGAAGAVQSG
jgi:hypothetical protein